MSKEKNKVPVVMSGITRKQADYFNLCPLDGRYAHIRDQLGPYFGEFGLVRERVHVEVEWLVFCLDKLIVPKNADVAVILDQQCGNNGNLPDKLVTDLRAIYKDFSVADMDRVKAIEKRTNHDVKAVEYFIDEKLDQMELGETRLSALKPLVHIGCTSEDITSVAHAKMLANAMHDVWIESAKETLQDLADMVLKYADVPMLAHTHGQPATPTTVGKELAVPLYRLGKSLQALQNIEPMAKFSGATGNYAAISLVRSNVTWPAIMRDFLSTRMGVVMNPCTTQIESHDWICRMMAELHLFNSILKDFCVDMWTYISMGYFKQITVAGEVGSSTMPNKVNPINYENAESNFESANHSCLLFMQELPLSRMQRDLTDSSTLRNLGLPFGYSLQALENVRKGLKKVELNAERIADDLDDHWEVLAEAVQTVLRKNGRVDAYETMKQMTRGVDFTESDYKRFVAELDGQISVQDQQKLLELTPAAYTGDAAKTARRVATTWGTDMAV